MYIGKFIAKFDFCDRILYNEKMIGIIDYNAGNITSVEHALEKIGVQFICSKRPCELEKCERIIFPGDGDAAFAMRELSVTGFDKFLRDFVASKRELLGICVGAQILFEHSEEGDVECLGLLQGTIRHFSNVWNEAGIAPYSKIPHMGWNDVVYANGGSPLFDGVAEHSDFYFIHSYMICPDDWSIVKGYAEYGAKVPACVSCGNITAFQFHPEKSGKCGMKLLENFCRGSVANALSDTAAFAPHNANQTTGGASC